MCRDSNDVSWALPLWWWHGGLCHFVSRGRRFLPLHGNYVYHSEFDGARSHCSYVAIRLDYLLLFQQSSCLCPSGFFSPILFLMYIVYSFWCKKPHNKLIRIFLQREQAVCTHKKCAVFGDFIFWCQYMNTGILFHFCLQSHELNSTMNWIFPFCLCPSLLPVHISASFCSLPDTFMFRWHLWSQGCFFSVETKREPSHSWICQCFSCFGRVFFFLYFYLLFLFIGSQGPLF